MTNNIIKSIRITTYVGCSLIMSVAYSAHARTKKAVNIVSAMAEDVRSIEPCIEVSVNNYAHVIRIIIRDQQAYLKNQDGSLGDRISYLDTASVTRNVKQKPRPVNEEKDSETAEEMEDWIVASMGADNSDNPIVTSNPFHMENGDNTKIKGGDWFKVRVLLESSIYRLYNKNGIVAAGYGDEKDKSSFCGAKMVEDFDSTDMREAAYFFVKAPPSKTAISFSIGLEPKGRRSETPIFIDPKIINTGDAVSAGLKVP